MAYPLRSKTAISGFSLLDEDIDTMKKVTKGRARNRINCHECFESFTSEFDYDAHTQRCQIRYIQKVKEQEAIYENHLKRISQDAPCFLSSMKLLPNSDDDLKSEYKVAPTHNHYNESQLPYKNFNHTITSLTNHSKFLHEIQHINYLFRDSVCNSPMEGLGDKVALNMLTDYPPSPLWLSNFNAQAIFAENHKTRFSSRLPKVIKNICVTNSIKEPRYYNNINLTSLLCQQSFDKYIKFFEKHNKYEEKQTFEVFNKGSVSYENERVSYSETSYASKNYDNVHAYKKPIMYLKTPKYEKYCERYEYTSNGHQNGRNIKAKNPLVQTKSDNILYLSSYINDPDKSKTKHGTNVRINGLIGKLKKCVGDDGTILAKDFLFSALYPSVFSQLVYKKYLPCINLQDFDLRSQPTKKGLSTQVIRQQILTNAITLTSNLNNQITNFAEVYLEHLSRLEPPRYIPPYSICTCCFYQVKSTDSQQSHALNISQSLIKYAKSKTQTTKSLAIKKKYSPQNLHKKKVKYAATKLSPVKPKETVSNQHSPRKVNAMGRKSILIDLTEDEAMSRPANSSQLFPKLNPAHGQEVSDKVICVDLTLDSDTDTISCKSFASRSSKTSLKSALSLASSTEELGDDGKLETELNGPDILNRVSSPRLKRIVKAPPCCSIEDGPCSIPGHRAKRSKPKCKPKSKLDPKVHHAQPNCLPPPLAQLSNGYRTNDDRTYFKPRKKSRLSDDTSPIKTTTTTQLKKYPRDKLASKNIANGHIADVETILPKCKLLLHCHLCAHKESFQSQEDIQMKIAYHCSNFHKNVQFYIDMSETHDFETGYDITLVECRPS